MTGKETGEPGRARRREVLGGGAALLITGGCANGVGSTAGSVIDSRVESTKSFLFSTYPGAAELGGKARGILWMPLMTKAGFFVGGAYGEGALRIDEATVDYYSAATGSFGFQIGAQQFAHALFFLTDDALNGFRTASGWTLGADAEFAVPDQGGSISASSLTTSKPVVAVVYGQSGLLIGASLAGTKYTRIIR